MSRELLNTLFVMTQGAYVHLEGETAKVEVDQKTLLQTPLHHLGGIVIFGNIMMSPHLMYKCASEGRMVTFLDMGGRYRARVVQNLKRKALEMGFELVSKQAVAAPG